MTTIAEPPIEEEVTRVGGVLAEFTTPDDLLKAAAAVRDAGYRKFDCHMPYPVHGADEAMGIKPTILPWLVLCGGLTGVTIGLVGQLYLNGIDYPWVVSGKPMFSGPANIPISFETTILLSALTAFFGVLALCGLPELYHKVFSAPRFHRFSSDRFFISIDADDPKFSLEDTTEFLDTLAPDSIDEYREPVSPAGVPRGLVLTTVVLVIVATIPLFNFMREANEMKTQPRLQLVLDMDTQPKAKSQSVSGLFADRRAMRPPVFGAVARGFYKDDDPEFFTGQTAEGDWVTALPIEPNEDAFRRGKERYEIHCAACHGYDGLGQGLVNARAIPASGGRWAPAANLVTGDRIPTLPVGYIYQVISHGVPREGEPGGWTMPGYAASIKPADRWAIVFYMEILQRRQHGTVEDLTPQQRRELEQLPAAAPGAAATDDEPSDS